jgi:hypothetical protein
MASKTFEVKEHKIALHRDYEVFTPAGLVRCTGRVLCTGRPRGASADLRLQILFLAPESPLPANVTNLAEHEATIYLPDTRFHDVLALLRSGESLYGYVSDSHPLSNQIRTSFDPVDEE